MPKIHAHFLQVTDESISFLGSDFPGAQGGQETDIVSKEMFIIDKEKADGDKSICLRPENTASIIRACHENGIQRFPWKVFTFGPMFRYERPQKGRLRQFHQFSIEVVGTTSIAQDAHFIKMLDVLFGKTFLTCEIKLE